MYGRPRHAGEGEMNLMKYFARWNADVWRAKRLIFSVGWDEVYWQGWAELVGQNNLSHCCRLETTLDGV
jgi:hypothetical protein